MWILSLRVCERWSELSSELSSDQGRTEGPEQAVLKSMSSKVELILIKVESVESAIAFSTHEFVDHELTLTKITCIVLTWAKATEK